MQLQVCVGFTLDKLKFHLSQTLTQSSDLTSFIDDFIAEYMMYTSYHKSMTFKAFHIFYSMNPVEMEILPNILHY